MRHLDPVRHADRQQLVRKDVVRAEDPRALRQPEHPADEGLLVRLGLLDQLLGETPLFLGKAPYRPPRAAG